MAEARKSKRAKSKSVRIVSWGEPPQIEVLELKEHALRVECGEERGCDGESLVFWSGVGSQSNHQSGRTISHRVTDL